MQKRFWISTHAEYPQATMAKEALSIINPDTNYQIRKAVNGYHLVERFNSAEAKVIAETHNKEYNKKRKTKRARNTSLR